MSVFLLKAGEFFLFFGIGDFATSTACASDESEMERYSVKAWLRYRDISKRDFATSFCFLKECRVSGGNHNIAFPLSVAK